jgi:hypothetical protein
MKLNTTPLYRPAYSWTCPPVTGENLPSFFFADRATLVLSIFKDDCQTRSTYCTFRKHSTSRLALYFQAIQQQVTSQVNKKINGLQPLSNLVLVKLVDIGGNNE